MSCGGGIGALGLIAGAGMLGGTALGVAPSLTSTIGGFTSLPITQQFSNIVTSATSQLSGGVLDSLRTLGANTLPSLTNAIPGGFSGALSSLAPGGMFNGGMTGLIGTTATNLMGAGDLGKFPSIFNAAQTYASQTSEFINAAQNAGQIASTFVSNGGMDGLITGGFSQVSEAFGALGSDLSKLGKALPLDKLADGNFSLGTPSSLIGQIVKEAGGIPDAVNSAIKSTGVNLTGLAEVASKDFSGFTGSVEKALYEGMKAVDGDALVGVKKILGVSPDVKVNNLAGLLNPAEILSKEVLPTLTTVTPDGLRGIYNKVGAVNSKIEKYFTKLPKIT